MMAGSALGGTISLWIVKTHPEIVSGVALLSPWLRVGDQKLIDALGDPGWTKNVHVCLEMGDTPGHNYPGSNPVADARDLAKYLDSAGLQKNIGGGYQYEEIRGLTHDESGWQTRVESILTCLLGRQTS